MIAEKDMLTIALFLLVAFAISLLYAYIDMRLNPDIKLIPNKKNG